MGNQIRSHIAVGEPDQVEPRRARGEGEISDADKVSVGDAVVMSLQGIERALKQTGGYLASDSVRLRKSRPSACRRSEAG